MLILRIAMMADAVQVVKGMPGQGNRNLVSDCASIGIGSDRRRILQGFRQWRTYGRMSGLPDLRAMIERPSTKTGRLDAVCIRGL